MSKVKNKVVMKEGLDNGIKTLFIKAFEALNGLRFVENKFSALTHILGFYRGNYIIYHLKNGQKIKVRNGKQDRTVILSINEIFLKDFYKVPKKNRKVILDLGANIGTYSLYASSTNKNAKIYSFEPDPYCFKQLKNNIKINKLENQIVPFNLAISKDGGVLEFYKQKTSSRGNSLLRKSGNKVRVNTTTLEKIFEDLKLDRVDIVEMDIEGAEYEVIYNCPDRILEKIDILSVECHEDVSDIDSDYTYSKMKKFLKSKGFKVISESEMVITFKRK